MGQFRTRLNLKRPAKYVFKFSLTAYQNGLNVTETDRTELPVIQLENVSRNGSKYDTCCYLCTIINFARKNIKNTIKLCNCTYNREILHDTYQ